MARSDPKHLTVRDLRTLFRILGECRDLGADNFAWRSHLLERLRDELGGIITISLSADRPRGSDLPVPFSQTHMIMRGPRESKSLYRRYLAQGEETRDLSCLAQFGSSQRIITCLRRELVEDRAYYDSVRFNEFCRPAGADDFIRSLFWTRFSGRCHILAVQRGPRDRRFSRRDRNFLHLLHAELGGRIGAELASESEPGTAGLSPRLRQTLSDLLDGYSEKEIARRFELSPATVHEYVTRLYRHFVVNSRSELMSRCLRRGDFDPWRFTSESPRRGPREEG